MQEIKIMRLSKEAAMPEYKTEGASGMDLSALVDGEMTIESGSFAVIPTGLSIAMPEGMECQIRSRSGLAAKNGVMVLNSPGTIDSDYRGEICVILMNLGRSPFTVKSGDRIAQMVFARTERVSLSEQDALPPTKRGGGGLGSTGV